RGPAFRGGASVNHCRKLPARMASATVLVLASFGFLAACGEAAEAEFIGSEVHSLSACDDAAGCEEVATASEGSSEGGWGNRCTSDDQCNVGECVCGVCSESCEGEPDACSGLPEGATCFGGRTLPRAALCHATTVPGICLLPCDSDDECGAGLVCA